MKLNRTKKGFTIVELVIVIAVIGVLSAILIPTFANLTNDARAAANKQQVADAYTAYLVEATNDQYDDLYTREGASAPYTYEAFGQKVTLAQKSQNDVVLKLDNEHWYSYDSTKGGWQLSTSALSHGAVVASGDAISDVLYQKNGENSYVKLSAADAATTYDELSTFNGVKVYVKNVA